MKYEQLFEIALALDKFKYKCYEQFKRKSFSIEEFKEFVMSNAPCSYDINNYKPEKQFPVTDITLGCFCENNKTQYDSPFSSAKTGCFCLGRGKHWHYACKKCNKEIDNRFDLCEECFYKMEGKKTYEY